ncbi:EamA family transporter [Candidatus Woesearchaeota archaeon]|nr:EamA family transporter [Candidatus Woesearchaeota archaeon]
MTWFFFAIVSTLFWSAGAVLLKFVRIRYIKSTTGYLVIIAPVALLSLVLLLFGKLQIPSTKILIYILIISTVGFIGYWLYLTALHKEEVSRIITFVGLGPLMVLILSTIFLQETLTMNDYLAFPLIIIGSMLISIKREKKRFKFSSGFILVFAAMFFFSLRNLFMKLAAEVDFISMIILSQPVFLAIITFLFIFSKNVRKKTREDLKQLNKKKLFVMYAAEGMGLAGLVFAYLAIQRGPVSLVALTHGTQSLFVIILATLISVFLPNILKEEINKKTISLKIISSLLMLTGLYLIVI